MNKTALFFIILTTYYVPTAKCSKLDTKGISFKNLLWNQKVDLCNSLGKKFYRDNIHMDSFLNQPNKTWRKLSTNEKYQACYGVSNVLKTNFHDMNKESFLDFLSSNKYAQDQLNDARKVLKTIRKAKIEDEGLLLKAMDDLEKSLSNVDYSERLLKATNLTPDHGYIYNNLLRNIALRKNIVRNNAIILNSAIYFFAGMTIQPNKNGNKK